MEVLPVERVFTLSGLRELGDVIQEQFERLEVKSKKIIMGLTINNFFKTQEQMDADFQAAYLQNLAFDEIRNNRDGYLNTNNPRRIDSGFMEENY